MCLCFVETLQKQYRLNMHVAQILLEEQTVQS